MWDWPFSSKIISGDSLNSFSKGKFISSFNSLIKSSLEALFKDGLSGEELEFKDFS